MPSTHSKIAQSCPLGYGPAVAVEKLRLQHRPTTLQGALEGRRICSAASETNYRAGCAARSKGHAVYEEIVSLPTSEPSTTFSPTISPEAHTTNTRVGDHLQAEVLSWRVTSFIGYATLIDHQVLVRTRSKGTRFANISLWFSKGALVMLSRNLVRFVVLFLGRSGSSNLIEALASHPEIIAKGELLAKKDEEGQLQAVRRFLTRPRAAGYAAAGFKTKLRSE